MTEQENRILFALIQPERELVVTMVKNRLHCGVLGKQLVV